MATRGITTPWTMGAGCLPATAAASGSKVVSDVEPGEHMFQVRAKGSSDSDRNTDADEIFSEVATITYMMPDPRVED